MYFVKKDEKISHEYMKIVEKVGNIIKKINSQLTYNKKYPKAKKNFAQNKAFTVLIYQ